MHAVIEDPYDVGAAQIRGGAGLTKESRARALVVDERRADQLDRDLRAEREVLRGPDRAHAAAADATQEPVAIGEDTSGAERGAGPLDGFARVVVRLAHFGGSIRGRLRWDHGEPGGTGTHLDQASVRA